MIGETLGGLSIFKTMFDLAKSIKDSNDAAVRKGATIELQEQILSAQTAQFALVEQVSASKTEIAKFETWDAEKQRYELKALGTHGVFAYSMKPSMSEGEPPHEICPDCYQERQKSILQQVTRFPGRSDVRVCHRCDWESYVSGGWDPAHAKGKTK